MKLASKTALFCILLAGAPLGATLLSVLPRYEHVVRYSEQRAALLAAAEVKTLVLRQADQVLDDARAVSAALTHAASSPAAEAHATEQAVRAVLATRRTIDVVRIEVPQKSIDTVLAKQDADASLAPRSNEAMRTESDRTGYAFAMQEPGRGLLVMPIPTTQLGPETRGYLTVPFYTQGFESDLLSLAEARGMSGVAGNIVVQDGAGKVIAASGSWDLKAGQSGAELPFAKVVPAGVPTGKIEIQVDYGTGDDELALTVMGIGSELGWTVGIAQPHRVVFAGLHEVQRWLAVIGAISFAAAIVLGIAAARRITEPLLRVVHKTKLIGQRAYRSLVPLAPRRDELGELDGSVHAMARDLEAQEKTIAEEAEHRANLARFMAPELVDAIIKGEHSLELGGRSAEISVLFADVVAFTPLAESQPPERTVAILNELFTLLSEVVFRHQGLVDKFVGDSLMAVWGAPVAQQDHASRALAAAEDMMRFLEPARVTWQNEYGVEIRLAIGIASGKAIVGNVGSNKRMEYTAIGDTVNIAARLETIASPNQVLVSETTQRLSGGDFPLRELGPKRLAGRASDTVVYELEVG